MFSEENEENVVKMEWSGFWEKKKKQDFFSIFTKSRLIQKESYMELFQCGFIPYLCWLR